MNAASFRTDTSRLSQQAFQIGDYALISDCHSAALVSRHGSIHWCCMPRFDSEPCFGRLLDWHHAGFCRIAPAEDAYDCAREYLDETMVLCTRFETGTGSVQMFDLLVLTEENKTQADRQLVRIAEGLEEQVELDVVARLRFGFGDIKAWLRQHDTDVFIAVGGENGLVICAVLGLKLRDRYSLGARIRVCKGERRHLSIQFSPPEQLDDGPQWLPDAEELDRQQRYAEARSTFERVARTANDLGLFSEQYDPQRQLLWSNFPLGLTHLSCITAALALRQSTDIADEQDGSTDQRRVYPADSPRRELALIRAVAYSGHQLR